MQLVKNHPQTIQSEMQLVELTLWHRGNVRSVWIALAKATACLTRDEIMAVFMLAIPDYQSGETVAFTLQR